MVYQRQLASRNPANQTGFPGATVSFIADTAGEEPLYLQWQFYDTNLPGQTQWLLTLPSIRQANAGPYRLLVSNPLRSTSIVATLTVKDLSLASEGLTPSGFRLVMEGDPATSYHLLSSSNLTQWSDLGPFSNQSGIFRFTDPAATNLSLRYYRALMP